MMRNRNGIEIKKCCASCRFRQINSEKGRFCKKHQKKVKAGWLCEDWEISKGLQGAGDSGGRIKSWKYLTYYRERWTEQRESYQAGGLRIESLLTTEQIRKEYEEQFGSIYISF